MIIRVFKVTIDPNHRTAFEKKFFTDSVNTVKDQAGLISCQLGKPTSADPNDYVMITHWRDKDSLIAFAGKDWKNPVIPKGMEKFSANFTLEHYELHQG